MRRTQSSRYSWYLCGVVGASMLAAAPAVAQQAYHNIVNQRFRTVGNGPQSALVVDVPGAGDSRAVTAAVEQAYTKMRRSRDPIMQRELAAMRRSREVKPGRQLDVADFAIVRRDGKLQNTRAAALTRATPNTLAFNFPTTGSNSWGANQAAQLTTLANALIGELTKVLGAPAWSGTVTVLNKDPNLGTVNEILGALFVFDPTSKTFQIWFPSFNDEQTMFLAMAQSMAQAWHGPDLIGYDAWEKGMGRAAAIIAAFDLKTFPGDASTTIDPANGFYYTPDYDILNQPPLGNNTFTPPTKGAEPGPSQNPTQFGGMMIPRLQMSGTAWLKCYIENPSFLSNFNAAYYTAFASDPTVANDVNRLRELAATALPTVEGQAFDAWYEQQYVLDTSVTVGTKLYAHTTATFPDSTAPAGAAVFLIYYLTTSTGDELDLNGTSQIVYWDYSFSNRLDLPTFESVNISAGFGSVAPFFQGIGGTPADQMRIAMDFPIQKDYRRVFFPTDQTGTVSAPNTFSGVVTGQDSGTLAATFNGGGSINTITATVAQGAYGAAGTVGTGFSRTKLVLTLAGSPTVTVFRNVYIDNGNVAPTFQIAALGNTATLNHSFANDVQMVSLPIRPLTTDMAVVMGATPSLALIAQYREDNTLGADQYLRYPMLPAYQPGYALWTDFPGVITNPNGIVGVPSDPVSEPNVSIGLQFGWNQIGPPWNLTMNVTSDIQFQYLGGTPADYTDAITNGWITAGVIGWDPTTGYEDITNPTDITIFPTNELQAWSGYWIRVNVPEGVTLTYLSPQSRATRAARSAAPKKPSASPAWTTWLRVTDNSSGRQSAATIGQGKSAGNTYNTTLDVSNPPDAPSGPSLLGLHLPAKHGDPAAKGVSGYLLTDIRPMEGEVTWDLAATVPRGKGAYTLSWGAPALLPKGMRLTLLDLTTGTRQPMNTTSSYSFQVGLNETTRLFQVIARPKSFGRLRISNVLATMPQRGVGRAASAMTISYELSAAGQATASVSLNGKVIRHLAQASRAVDAGVNQMVWDLKDDHGRSVGTGTYMLQITAQTPDGEQTRTIAPMIVVR